MQNASFKRMTSAFPTIRDDPVFVRQNGHCSWAGFRCCDSERLAVWHLRECIARQVKLTINDGLLLVGKWSLAPRGIFQISKLHEFGCSRSASPLFLSSSIRSTRENQEVCFFGSRRAFRCCSDQNMLPRFI